MYIATASTSLEGSPRVTKYHGDIKRPQVASEYCDMSAAVDIHNHYRTGSIGLEDAVRTKSGFIRQFCGVIGFLATNTFLTTTNFYNFESPRNQEHLKFKMELASRLTRMGHDQRRVSRIEQTDNNQLGFTGAHSLKKFPGLRNNKPCYYCKHGYAKPTDKRNKTTWYCRECGPQYPLCSPETGRVCFELHKVHGIPKKRYFRKHK
jgi:hypothetical protein